MLAFDFVVIGSGIAGRRSAGRTGQIARLADILRRTFQTLSA